MSDKNIVDLVRKMEDDDQIGNTTISKYVTYSQRENIEKIDAYANSKHVSGEKDSFGRDKPFFNIVTSAINIWYRATAINRSKIKVKATKGTQIMLSFSATLLIQQWMRKTKFGIFLQEWGKALAKYGSSVVKFVEKNGELYSEVVPWNRMICDPVDFDSNPRIEVLWLTPAQIRANKGYDQDLVEKLIEAVGSRETADGQKKDNKEGYIKLYEIHGNMKLSYITQKDDDDDTYVQQMSVVSYIDKKDGKYDDYSLVSGREKKDPYMITHLIKEEDRTVSIGAVENLFESQWMINHNKKIIKDQLDLASKLFFQTSDGNFIGQNVLDSLENGQILIHQPNQPLTNVANRADIGALQAYGNEWISNADRINGIAESMTTRAKSGTAWRQTEAELAEAHSLFELMTEGKGLYLDDMFREYIIPHIKKKMDTSEEISEILEEHQIRKIDSMYVPNEAKRRSNNKFKEMTLAGKVPQKGEQQMFIEEETANIQNGLNAQGNQRFIKPSDISDKTWKEVLKDIEWDMEIDITGEHKDTNAVMTTLNNLFQSIVGLQGQPMPEDAKLVFNKILEETGVISPIEIKEAQNAQQPIPAPEAPAPIPA